LVQRGTEVRGWLASDKYVAAIEAEAEAARNAGIDGVPCFILGGVFAVSGAQSPEYLADAIERAAAERRAAAPADAQA
jgi:predicted DsbA family dithiol-disulfide isomerase